MQKKDKKSERPYVTALVKRERTSKRAKKLYLYDEYKIVAYRKGDKTIAWGGKKIGLGKVQILEALEQKTKHPDPNRVLKKYNERLKKRTGGLLQLKIRE